MVAASFICRTIPESGEYPMKKVTKASAVFVLLFYLLLSGCGSSQIPEPTSTPSARITSTLTLTPTKTPTSTPTITPTPIGGGSGAIIFSEGWTLYSMDTSRGNKKLIDKNCSWNITFSPDGRYMTCSMFKQMGEHGYGGFGVILVDLKTHKVIKRLIGSTLIGPEFFDDSGSTGYDPDYEFYYWSPDSKQFAFVGTHEGKSGLFVLDIENSSIKLLYENPNLYYPVWSPGSTKIMFFEMVNSTNGRNHVYVVNTDGTDLVQVTNDLAYYSSLLSIWGKDDNTVFLNDHEFKGINLETMEPTGETLPWPDPANHIISSPNHQYNLTIRNVDEAIYLESKDESQKIDITKYFTVDTTRPSDDQFKWSPDNKTLAHYDPKEKSIVLFSIESLTPAVLAKVAQPETGQSNNNYGQFLWLPDGKHIIFVQANNGDGYQIAMTDLSGKVKVLYTTKAPVGIHAEPTMN